MTVVDEQYALGEVPTGRVICEWFEGTKSMSGTFAETSLEEVPAPD